MIKSIGFFLLWLAGSAAAVAVAWTGVSIVDDELIDPAPANQIAGGAPIPTATALAVAATLASEGEDATTPQTSEDPPATEAPQTSVAVTATLASESNDAESPETSSGSSATEAPQTSASQTSVPSTSVLSTETSASTSTTAPTTTATSTSTTARPAPTTAPAQTLTFNLVGGSAAISFSAAGVQILWATPNPGFTVQLEPEDDRTRVDFEADHHDSRIDAWWADGPQHRIREKAD